MMNPLNENKIIEGIRLHNLELYNWGTFDKSIWVFNPNGTTSLLTGKSGSGKSTVVDALVTILVPPKKIAYNKAADASARERTARSYVLGYYGRKYNYEGKGSPEALRDERNYSVILATFKDMITEKTISLAICFWFKEKENAPLKMYVVSEKELFIKEHFSNFNTDTKVLKDNLKKIGAEVFDDYKKYSENFRKLMGGVSEQAIELFQQTISMKKVEALNDFVRESMLEKDDVDKEIDALLKHYHDLSSAYDAVKRAKAQIDKLDPICEKGADYTKKDSEKNELEMARQALEMWFATKKTGMLKSKIEDTEIARTAIKKDISKEEERKNHVSNEIKETEASIRQNGGEEISRLKRILGDETEKRKTRFDNLSKYNRLAEKLELKVACSVQEYNENLSRLDSKKTKLQERNNDTQKELDETAVAINKCSGEKSQTERELESLRARSSNIPRKLIELREKLCTELNLHPEQIPFAGELLEVRESELKWEGAIERLVNSFAISLLVPEYYYGKVANWVNKEQLGTKLVYFHVGKPSKPNAIANADLNTVFTKLLVKRDTLFTEWLKMEIEYRFNHVCCEEISDFKREHRAITLTGQIKSNIRHEKDDRQKLSDRTRYVLGFSNKKKVQVLKEMLRKQQEELIILENEKSEKLKTQNEINNLLHAVTNLMEFENFKMLDVGAVNKIIDETERKIAELNESNNILNTLNSGLEKLKKEEADLVEKIKSLLCKEAVLNDHLENYRKEQRENDTKLLNETDIEKNMYPFLEVNYKEFVGDVKLNLENSAKIESRYNNSITGKYNKLQNQIASLKSEIEKDMAKFRAEYPGESIEMSENVEYLKEYNELLNKLQYHNLPKYLSNFKQELQGKIIDHISMFNGLLGGHRKSIKKKIAEINESLRLIDYSPGRYIMIKEEDTPEADIRGFRNRLKACTQGMTSGLDDEIAENKFSQIKEIIERFKGRLNNQEADKRWTAKVTDVRKWFIFSASERWRDSDEEYEHYSDSDGKSGGQKEKLAYTILAASLVYNYRLNKSANKVSTFRLVVIDEAFLKSSDDSAKFGLSLFEQMNFQLLVVTPNQKTSTIEPFIEHVGFVKYEDITHTSTLSNIPIGIYKANRKQWEEKYFE